MNLSKYLPLSAVILETENIDKETLLRKLCRTLVSSPIFADVPLSKIPEIEMLLIHREEQHAPTGLGNGIAFPHARLEILPRPGLAIAVLRQPIDFRAPDNQPAQIVCLLLAPDNNPSVALHIQSQCIRLLLNPTIHDSLITARDAEQIYRIFGESEIELDRSITARDFMQKPRCEITAEMPLRTVTHLMSRSNVNCAPVVDRNRQLLGHISCKRLFNFGLPDFFAQLKSVSFIKDFDPFEKYFFQESHVTAGDVMTTDFCAMPSDATILEIVFALTVKNQPNVYIVEDRQLTGIVDQEIVLEHIINF